MRGPRLSIGLGSFLVALALVVAVGIGSAIGAIPTEEVRRTANPTTTRPLPDHLPRSAQESGLA